MQRWCRGGEAIGSRDRDECDVRAIFTMANIRTAWSISLPAPVYSRRETRLRIFSSFQIRLVSTAFQTMTMNLI